MSDRFVSDSVWLYESSSTGPSESPPAGWALLGTGEVVRLAGPGARIAAKLVDWLVAVAITSVFLTIVSTVMEIAATERVQTAAGTGREAQTADSVLLLAAFIAVAFMYETCMLAHGGQTVGRMIARVSVVQIGDGSHPTLGRSAVRLSASWFFGIFTYISLLWDRNCQGMHNKIAATLVTAC